MGVREGTILEVLLREYLEVFLVLDVADCVVGTESNVTEATTKKGGEHNRVGVNSTVFFEALASRFVRFRENGLNPRRIQPGRIGAAGRG